MSVTEIELYDEEDDVLVKASVDSNNSGINLFIITESGKRVSVCLDSALFKSFCLKVQDSIKDRAKMHSEIGTVTISTILD